MIRTLLWMYAQFKHHPLTSSHPLVAFLNFVRWQIGARILKKKVIVPWVDDARFILGVGETGLSVNLYYGLGEFEDMLFLMHALRPEETFVDIGANIGAYTILASSICKAHSISFEPVPETIAKLEAQIRINGIGDYVRVENKGVGDKPGRLIFSNNKDTTNKVILNKQEGNTVEVDVIAIDHELETDRQYVFKIDVEGYEYFVIEGAKKILSSQNTSALIIEINRSAEEFGFSNHDIHHAICALGFQAVTYDPFTRNLTPIGTYNEKGGNTIYVKDIIAMAERCRTAPKRKIHTANGVIL